MRLDQDIINKQQKNNFLKKSKNENLPNRGLYRHSKPLRKSQMQWRERLQEKWKNWGTWGSDGDTIMIGTFGTGRIDWEGSERVGNQRTPRDYPSLLRSVKALRRVMKTRGGLLSIRPQWNTTSCLWHGFWFKKSNCINGRFATERNKCIE